MAQLLTFIVDDPQWFCVPYSTRSQAVARI